MKKWPQSAKCLLQQAAMKESTLGNVEGAACLFNARLYLAGPDNYRRLTSGQEDIFLDHWIRQAAQLRELSTIRCRWNETENALLRDRYYDTPTKEIAQLLGRYEYSVWAHANKLGLRKSAALIAEQSAEKMKDPDHGGRLFQFKPGIVPHNKGLRRPGYAPGLMGSTMFKKGERSGAASKNWRPIGTILKDTDGYLRIKIRENNSGEATGFGNNKIWPMLHRYEWEKAHGPVPPGHTVVFKDGNRSDTRLENLELVSRRELMARNTVHNLPQELVEVIQLNGVLKRRIGNMEKRYAEKQDVRSA